MSTVPWLGQSRAHYSLVTSMLPVPPQWHAAAQGHSHECTSSFNSLLSSKWRSLLFMTLFSLSALKSSTVVRLPPRGSELAQTGSLFVDRDFCTAKPKHWGKPALPTFLHSPPQLLPLAVCSPYLMASTLHRVIPYAPPCTALLSAPTYLSRPRMPLHVALPTPPPHLLSCLPTVGPLCWAPCLPASHLTAPWQSSWTPESLMLCEYSQMSTGRDRICQPGPCLSSICSQGQEGDRRGTHVVAWKDVDRAPAGPDPLGWIPVTWLWIWVPYSCWDSS